MKNVELDYTEFQMQSGIKVGGEKNAEQILEHRRALRGTIVIKSQYRMITL